MSTTIRYYYRDGKTQGSLSVYPGSESVDAVVTGSMLPGLLCVEMWEYEEPTPTEDGDEECCKVGLTPEQARAIRDEIDRWLTTHPVSPA